MKIRGNAMLLLDNKEELRFWNTERCEVVHGERCCSFGFIPEKFVYYHKAIISYCYY